MHGPVPLVCDDEATGCVGVAGDAEEAEVVLSVVLAAETAQVRGVGGAAVFPVHDVVYVEFAAAAATGNDAAAVTVFDHPSRPVRD